MSQDSLRAIGLVFFPDISEVNKKIQLQVAVPCVCLLSWDVLALPSDCLKPPSASQGTPHCAGDQLRGSLISTEIPMAGQELGVRWICCVPAPAAGSSSALGCRMETPIWAKQLCPDGETPNPASLLFPHPFSSPIQSTLHTTTLTPGSGPAPPFHAMALHCCFCHLISPFFPPTHEFSEVKGVSNP